MSAEGRCLKLRIRTELCEDGCEEIVIRCGSENEQVRRILSALEGIVGGDCEIILQSSGTEYYMPIRNILFFETYDGRVMAHTRSGTYITSYKLCELEHILPATFVRISKSTVANIMMISSLHRELVGNGDVGFFESEKKAYFSRGYYKVLRDKIDEMRLGR